MRSEKRKGGKQGARERGEREGGGRRREQQTGFELDKPGPDPENISAQAFEITVPPSALASVVS